MPTPRQQRLLFNARRLTYLLRDLFNTAASAPLASPRTCEPGPGTLTIVDTNNIMSTSSGQFVVNGTPAALDRITSAASYARYCGRVFLISFPARTTMGGNPRVGFDASLTNSNVDLGVDYSTTSTVRIKVTTAIIPDSVVLGSGQHDFAFVMRTTGAFLLARAGGSGAYTLLWVDNTITTANSYAKGPWFGGANAQNFTIDDYRVTDLAGPWTTDYGPATDRKAGTQATNNTFNHNADVLAEWSVAYNSTDASVQIRRTDASNSWEIWAQSGGNLALYRNQTGNNGVAATSAAVFTNGNTYRIVVTAEGTTYKVYVDNVLKITHTDAGNHNTTAMGGFIVAGGTRISDIVAWPRKVMINA